MPDRFADLRVKVTRIRPLPLDDSAEIDEWARTHDDDGAEIEEPAPCNESERRRMSREFND